MNSDLYDLFVACMVLLIFFLFSSLLLHFHSCFHPSYPVTVNLHLYNFLFNCRYLPSTLFSLFLILLINTYYHLPLLIHLPCITHFISVLSTIPFIPKFILKILILYSLSPPIFINSF